MGIFGPPNIDKLESKGDVKGLLKAALRHRDRDRMIRQRAFKALNSIVDARAVGPLVAALKFNDNDVRSVAAHLLGKIGDASAVDALISALTDEKYYVREAAARSLGMIGDVKALDPLREVYFRDQEFAVRKEALEALGGIADPYAMVCLKAALKDNNPQIRATAAVALEKAGWKPEEADAETSYYYIARKNWDACVQMADKAVDPLTGVLEDEDQWVRMGAARALGQIGNPKAIGPLIDALYDSELGVRIDACDALIKMGTSAVDALIGSLADKRHYVREGAVRALGEIGDAKAVEPLGSALQDENPGFREEVVSALRMIGTVRAMELIEKKRPESITYHNSKWNLSLDYPEGWEIVWENEPDGGWEIVVGITGKPSRSGKPVVTVRVLRNAVLNFYPGPVFAAGGPGAPMELPRTPEEYNEICKRELKEVLPGLQFLSEETGTLAGMASATLSYSYTGRAGTVLEKQINIFGTTVTYRLLYEAPEEQSEFVEEYFDSIISNFRPFAG